MTGIAEFVRIGLMGRSPAGHGANRCKHGRTEKRAGHHTPEPPSGGRRKRWENAPRLSRPGRGTNTDETSETSVPSSRDGHVSPVECAISGSNRMTIRNEGQHWQAFSNAPIDDRPELARGFAFSDCPNSCSSKNLSFLSKSTAPEFGSRADVNHQFFKKINSSELLKIDFRRFADCENRENIRFG